MGIYLVINIAIVIFMIWFARRRKRVTANGKAVLISGCDTGFGNLAAKALDKLNFCVLAGCFTEEGMEKLDKETSDNVIVFHLDVTDEKSIEEAKDLVYKYCSSRQLWAVVNNAGVLLGFETEVTSMKTFKRVMDVNFLGMVALTKKVLPLIRKSRGRVINIASILGRYASRGFDAYIASKFAVIGWSDCLRQSLSVWGCKVITIEPGVMNTNLLNNLVYSFDDDFSKSTEEVKADYGRDYVKNATRLLNLIEKKRTNPQYVCNKVVAAVTRYFPDNRYIVGADAALLSLLSCLPIILRDKIAAFCTLFYGVWTPPAALRKSGKLT